MNCLKKHQEVVWLIAILILSTLLRLTFLHEPFDRDEGHYATIAQEILRGGLPYRDAIEIKPPGVFYLYALAIGLFGATTEAVRSFTALYALVTVVAVYGVARLSAGSRAGIYAAFVYGIFSTFPLLQGSNSNTEVFLVLPMTAGLWLLLKAFETKIRLYFYGVGLCAALALLIKPVALPVVALEFLMIPFFRSGARRWRDSAFDMAAILIPMCLCAATVLVYFSLRGGFEDFIYWTIEFPRKYRGSRISGPTFEAIYANLKYSLMVPVLVGIPSAIWLAVTKRGIVNKLHLPMIFAVSLAVVLPGKYFPHYFIMIIPFLAISAGIGLAHIIQLRREQSCMILLVVCALFSFSIWKNIKYYTEYSPETVSIMKYGGAFVNAVGVARYIGEHTSQNDYIFQWGFEPEIYFLSDRRCPNPYLVSLLPSWSKNPSQAINLMMQSLIDKKPTYIIVQEEWSNFPGYVELTGTIQVSYHQEVVLGWGYNRYYLYRLNRA